MVETGLEDRSLLSRQTSSVTSRMFRKNLKKNSVFGQFMVVTKHANVKFIYFYDTQCKWTYLLTVLLSVVLILLADIF